MWSGVNSNYKGHGWVGDRGYIDPKASTLAVEVELVFRRETRGHRGCQEMSEGSGRVRTES